MTDDAEMRMQRNAQISVSSIIRRVDGPLFRRRCRPKPEVDSLNSFRTSETWKCKNFHCFLVDCDYEKRGSSFTEELPRKSCKCA